MSGLWLGLCLLISAATVWLPEGRWTIGLVLLLLALCATAVGRFRQSKAAPSQLWPRGALAFLATLAVVAIALPPIGRWGCAAAAAGLLARVVAGRRRMGAATAEALLGAGLATAGCAALQPIYLSLWARAQGWAPLAALVQSSAAAAGWDARAWDATLALRDGDTVYRHALTPEGLCPYPLLCLALLGAGLALAGPRRALDAARFAGILSLYCLARYLLLVRLTVEGFSGDLFWDPTVLSLSVVAVAPLVALAVSRLSTDPSPNPLWERRRVGRPTHGWPHLRCSPQGEGPSLRDGPQGEAHAATGPKRGTAGMPSGWRRSQGGESVPPSIAAQAPISPSPFRGGGWGEGSGPRRLLRPPGVCIALGNSISWRATVLLFAVAGVVGLSAWSGAGAPKPGRVLIDESHSDWSSTLRPFDTGWFGNDATYNYASFAEYLNHFFRVSLNDREPVTPRLLSGYDVLLVKMPTRAYTASEREAIDAFVRGGGGLWLIGDHTNVFGTSTHLNALSAPMGIRFRADATWELGSGGPALWKSIEPPATHPVLRHVSRFEFQTGCSLQASLRTEDLMTAPRLVSRAADYATPNFFPQAQPNNYNGAFGPALLAAATRYGAGRMVAFTDSTSFSTFSMFATGRPELAVDTVAWLNRRNRPLWPAWVCWLTALAAEAWLLRGAAHGAAAVGAAARKTALPIGAFALTALLGGGLGSRMLADTLVPATPVRPEAPLRRVYFLTAGTDALFENLDPLYWNTADDPERRRRFTTFLVGTQRFGLVPTMVTRVPDAGPAGDLLVIAYPHASLSPAERRHLEAFVRRGGRVLVLPDNQENGTRDATLDDLLRPFGLDCGGRLPGDTTVSVPGAELQMRFRQPFQFHGGTVVARECLGAPPAAGRAVLARADLGRGFLLAAGDGQLFANVTLGNHFDVPSGAQWDATALQLWLFRQLLLADRAVTRVFPPRCGPTDWASDSPDRTAARGAKRRT